ncbi:hypothetical protein FOQG_17954 [Fusarium oxysporum f. sp. raphani 54005]|uniref:Secreted protein n=1 Tax=Fusarium oxysporum f. sp. raphani 54005 TaxID=1089458 RepID=X0B5D8_FUSOX|nr:hypothetical protein FOQG_17954 [Fusarium oxysporum f. sp. raphani 54005]
MSSWGLLRLVLPFPRSAHWIALPLIGLASAPKAVRTKALGTRRVALMKREGRKLAIPHTTKFGTASTATPRKSLIR